MSLSKAKNSFYVSGSNTLPFTLARNFNSVGADTFGYHNFDAYFYARNISHPNMGYDVFKTPTTGLDMHSEWKNASDLDMIKASIGDYINTGKQFHTYYMTYSGHYQYDWENPMCEKNRDKVEHLDYSETVKAYISCNLELEYALSYLMEELENAGIADKTVIVLSTDHYPYGLTDEEYSELAGFEIAEPFGKYESSFICWNGGMEDTVIVDDVCCTADILPTLLNLFGFEYDSRVIIGRDVFSDSEKIAILSDKSFITENYMYNAVTNTVTVINGGGPSAEVINVHRKYVQDAIIYSRHILQTDFYSYIIKYIN